MISFLRHIRTKRTRTSRAIFFDSGDLVSRQYTVNTKTRDSYMVRRGYVTRIAKKPTLRVRQGSQHTLRIFDRTAVRDSSQSVLSLIVRTRDRFLRITDSHYRPFLTSMVRANKGTHRTVSVLNTNLRGNQRLYQMLLVREVRTTTTNRRQRRFRKPITRTSTPHSLQTMRSFISNRTRGISIRFRRIGVRSTYTLKDVSSRRRVILPTRTTSPFRVHRITNGVQNVISRSYPHVKSRRTFRVEVGRHPGLVGSSGE